jgi:hypothetical protein
MRCWRAPTGEFVVEGPDGSLQEVYDTSSYGLDDDMYAWGHEVVGGVLTKYTSVDRTGFSDLAEDSEVRRTNTEEAVLDDLIEVGYEASGLPAFAPAFDAYRRRMAEAAEARQRPVVRMRASVAAVLSACSRGAVVVLGPGGMTGLPAAW